MKIYEPEEDSYLLQEILKEKIKLKDFKNKKILDMGSGSGIQTKTLVGLGILPENITLVDINRDVTKFLKRDFPNSKTIHSNLFSKIKGKFDLIVFNPPYLPDDKFDKKPDTSGGKNGSEITNKFLSQAKKHLTKSGVIFLLTSSLTKGINFKGYNKKLLKKKKLFFEELYVWELKRK
jgi:release factor glutamine methyltransferase